MLDALGVSESWFTNHKGNGSFLVCFPSKSVKNNSIVARVILGLKKKDRRFTVGYRDGSPFNLLRHNLVIETKGGAKAKKAKAAA